MADVIVKDGDGRPMGKIVVRRSGSGNLGNVSVWIKNEMVIAIGLSVDELDGLLRAVQDTRDELISHDS